LATRRGPRRAAKSSDGVRVKPANSWTRGAAERHGVRRGRVPGALVEDVAEQAAEGALPGLLVQPAHRPELAGHVLGAAVGVPQGCPVDVVQPCQEIVGSLARANLPYQQKIELTRADMAGLQIGGAPTASAARVPKGMPLIRFDRAVYREDEVTVCG